MSFASYTALQTELTAWIKRPDLVSKYPDMITLAEQTLLRELHLRLAETVINGTTSSDLIAEPVIGAIERIEVTWSGARYSLTYTSPNGISQLTYSPGRPTRFTLENNQIRLIPAPSSAMPYSVYYVPDLTPLSASNPSNWALANAPDAYLYGTLEELSHYTLDTEMAKKYHAMFMDAIDAVRRNDEGTRFPISGGLQIKPRNAR